VLKSLIKEKTSGKTILSIFVVLVVLIILLDVFLTERIIHYSNTLIDEKFVTNTNDFKRYIEETKFYSKIGSVSMSFSPSVVKAIAERDTKKLLKIFTPMHELYRIDYYTITDNKGIVLTRTHDPNNFGDSILNQQIVKEALAGKVSTYFEKGDVVKVSARTGAPVYNADNKVIGVVIAGVRFDSDSKVKKIKELFKADITVFLGNERIFTTITRGGESIVGTKLGPRITEIVLGQKQEYLGEADILDEKYETFYMPLLNAQNEAFAAIFMGVPAKELRKETNFFIMIGIAIWVIGFIFLFALLLQTRHEKRQHKIKIEERTLAEALEKRDKLLDAVNKAANILLTTNEEALEASLLYGMEMMGRSVDADRVYIMKNETIDGELYFVYQYEWVSDIGKQWTGIKKGTKVPYSFDAEWPARFHKGECLNEPLHNLPPNMQQFFSQTQTKSVLVIPMFIQDNFWGLASFSDCKNEKIFTDDEVNIMRSGALMMISAINRNVQAGEIREVHNRTRLLLDSMPYTCHLWNRNLEMFDCNEENVRMFHLEKKEEVMERFSDFYPEYQPDGKLSSELAAEIIKKAFDEGIFVGECMLRTSDGAPLPVEMTLVRVPYGGDYVVAAYARDLREHKKMMREIKAVQERLWEKVENGMVIIDIESRILLDVNPATCNMFGGERDEMIGKHCSQFFGQHECPIIDAGQTVDRGERKFIKSDGTVIPIQKSISRITYNGRSAFLESFNDISHFKKAEEQKRMLEVAEQANSAKSEFLANISHEMRTPLNAVLGLSGLTLEMDGLPEEAAMNLEKIYNSGSTLLNIVNDLLDISKIEAGKLEMIPNEYDIPSLINDVITQNVLRIGSKLIKFSLDISPDIPALLYGDDLRIKQILSNLLSNAFKYTKEGNVELGIRSEYAEGNEDVWITAWVRDTGVGIRPEDIKKLFSDYSQVDTKANRNIEGTGLGLAITKKMVELMGGTIGVESKYGEGSVFTIRFKQKFVSNTPIGESVVNNLKNFRYSDSKRKQSSRIVRIKMPYARVLVVDDNVTNLDVARGLMKPYEMQIDCVTRGQQAIDAILAEEGRYSAVFMDHMMPEMDGIEATQRIREIDTDYAKNIPIIALTANAIAGNEEKFLNKGFQDFLSKPIDLPRLDEALRKWVRDKSKEKDFQDEEQLANNETEVGGRLTCKIISGLNISKGLKRFGGDEEVYLNILRSYTVNTLPVLERIKDVDKDNLLNYATDVHGIKGSSYGIYANSVGDLAEELEKASKAGDFHFVNKKNKRLIKLTERLIIDINDMLSNIDAENPKQKKNKPDREALLKLMSACEDFDIDSVNKAMAEIGEYEYESGTDLIAWLKDNILEGNLDEIAERLSALTKEENF